MKHVISRYLFYGMTSLALLTIIMQSDESHAIGAFRPSAMELRMLPAYCAVRAEKWGNDKKDPRTKKWYSVFGNDFIHLHHYCGAILDYLKAPLEPTEKKRIKRYEHSLYNFDYVAERVSPNFILWPELLMFRSKVHNKLGHAGKAIKDAKAAVDRKPGYIKGIVNLADLLVQYGRREDAVKVIQDGLKIKPTSRILRHRMACLDRTRTRDCPDGY